MEFTEFMLTQKTLKKSSENGAEKGMPMMKGWKMKKGDILLLHTH